MIKIEDIEAAVENKRQEIIDACARSIVNSVSESVKYRIETEISESVKETIEEIIAGEVKTVITSQKDAILEGVRKSSIEIAATVGASLQKRAIENLEGWQGREILKKLFD